MLVYLTEIIRFFRTGKLSISPDETLKIMASIDAANRSEQPHSRAGGGVSRRDEIIYQDKDEILIHVFTPSREEFLG